MSVTYEHIAKIEQRVANLEDRAKRGDSIIDELRREMATARMEAKVRDEARSADIRALSVEVRTVVIEIAKSRGVQEDKIRQDERILRAWKKYSLILGIIFGFISMVGGIIVASPDFSSSFLVRFLHYPDSGIHATFTTGSSLGGK